MKVEPGAAVIFTLIQSERTVVPPVTAERSPPASRMTGADSPVIAELIDRSYAFDDFAVAGNEIPSLDENDVSDPQIERRDTLDDAFHPALALGIDQSLRMRVASRPAKGVGLRLAASFRDGFGEVGEQHRKPEPCGDLAREQRDAVVRDEIADKKDCHDRRNSLGHENHRIARKLCVDRVYGMRRSWRA